MAIRAVSFDFHGTLASVYPSPGAIYQRVAAEFGIEADADDLSRHFGQLAGRQSHEIPYGCDESDARDFWFAVIIDCFRSLGPEVKISETLCMALFDAFGRGSSWAFCRRYRPAWIGAKHRTCRWWCALILTRASIA